MEHSTASLFISVWRSKLYILLIACFVFSLVSHRYGLVTNRDMSATVRLPGMGDISNSSSSMWPVKTWP